MECTILQPYSYGFAVLEAKVRVWKSGIVCEIFGNVPSIVPDILPIYLRLVTRTVQQLKLTLGHSFSHSGVKSAVNRFVMLLSNQSLELE